MVKRSIKEEAYLYLLDRANPEVEYREALADILRMYDSPWLEDVWCSDIEISDLEEALEKIRGK